MPLPGPTAPVPKEGGLKPLLDVGLLADGTKLWGSFHGQRHEATVDGDGFVLLPDGSAPLSPSGAGQKITGYATNGWKFWNAEVDGQELSLKQLREQERAKKA